MGITLKYSSTPQYWNKLLRDKVDELKDAWGLTPTPSIDRIPGLLEAALEGHDKLKSFWSAARKNGWEQAAIQDKQSMEHRVFVTSTSLTFWMYAVRDKWEDFEAEDLHKAWLDHEAVSKLEDWARGLDGCQGRDARRIHPDASRAKRVEWDDEDLDY
ncbi:hypothetical protein AC579_2112 [Pseudocercospora musae]|uniref:Uncharacterized protein n=1 Tax=Pseudocercospora musae TaxID=113226 RepID=A0A139GY25_9PEZI|nr:hypothetical protein AC579_2112 [Pseudocercospora musae]